MGETINHRVLRSNNCEYTVRLGKPTDEDNYFWVTLSCDGTRLETYEHDNKSDAIKDYHLMCQTIKAVLECERGG